VTTNSLGDTTRLISDSDHSKPIVELSFFERSRWLLLVSMIGLFMLAGVVRVYNLKAPGLLISREYTSAIIARDFYFEHTNSVEGWRKEIAKFTRQNQPILEPPVTEFLVSLIYRVVNREEIWFARFLTSAFWLVGGIFLYKVAERVVSTDAGVFATAFYLLTPLSILLSRSFQPDSLMMMLFLISLFSLIKYFEKPSNSNLFITAVLSGLMLLYRPLVLFTFFGAFVALSIYHKGTWRGLIDKKFLTTAYFILWLWDLDCRVSSVENRYKLPALAPFI
jgi:hypothetical protein